MLTNSSIIDLTKLICTVVYSNTTVYKIITFTQLKTMIKIYIYLYLTTK